MSSLLGIGNKITLDIHVSGYCEANAAIVDPRKKSRKIRFYAAWAHLYHPEYGHILVDTGYSDQFALHTGRFPEKLYALAVPVFIQEAETAVAVLEKKGVAATDIKYIVITHFHADHICALRDFPSAQFICSTDAYQQAMQLNGFRAVKKGIIKQLLPNDFAKRVLLIENIAKHQETLSGGLKAFSFFDSAEIRFVSLPGHGKGMMGILVETAGKNILYAADAQWDKNVFEAGVLPNRIVKVFFDSWIDFLDTTEKLRAYTARHPETLLLFTHCEQTMKYVDYAI